MIDTRVQVGSVELRQPVMTASGTAGYGTEFAPYLDLPALGALVTKSIAAFEWAGNPAPRVHSTPLGMINAVGLQGPGIESWIEHQLPDLVASGAAVVCSIWGRSVADYRAAADMLAAAPASVIAVEVNLSCPNVEGRGSIFAHDAALSAEVIAATDGCGRPRWAKLSPNTDRIVEVAAAVHEAGAEAVTLVNTLLGMVLDPQTHRPALGNGGGGVSGRAIHPVAVRAVYDVRAALPDLPIVGVGGVASGWEAAELMLAGAHAVQVGTATFADPRAADLIAAELVAWATEHGFARLSDLTNAAQ
ncbi:MAG TPA: dihydroorotate dehydrogenase [Ilumatobacter sp.]|nr:dihydroorotate dehydrogenase [Ilumatobacter sp.]